MVVASGAHHHLERPKGRLSDRGGGVRARHVETGDAHLLELEGSIPVLSPRAFLDSLS